MILEEFEIYLKDDKKSKKTIETYSNHLRVYFRWFEETTGATFSKLHRANVTDYISYMRTVKKLQPSSINAKISALIKFNQYLVQAGYQEDYVIGQDDMLKIQPKVSLYSKIDKKDVDRLLQEILDSDKDEAIRNYALGCVMAYSGLRVSEACKIKITAFDLRAMEISVLGKGDKYRVVQINEKTKSAIESWLRERKKRSIESEYLFSSNRKKPLDRTVVFKIINDAGEKLGLKVTPHELRHYYVSRALEVGLSIKSVSAMAGHSNINTTMLYAHSSKEELQKKLNEM